ncbi:MAG: chemotaxis protein CheW [Halobacteriaceae archaeon]
MATTNSDAAGVTNSDAQVLEFQLGSETYCLDIEYVAEIVDMGDLTTVPNSPPHVEGVMDLRGRTTSIINPKHVLNVGGVGDGRRIVVLDPDRMDEGEAIGWVVDEVYQVVRVDGSDVDDSPVEDEAIRGMLKRDDEFVIWLDPDAVVS